MEKNKKQKNTILIIGAVEPSTAHLFEEFKRSHEGKYSFALLKDLSELTSSQEKASGVFDKIIEADFNSENSLRESINSIAEEMVAVTARFESNMHLFKKTHPFLPKNLLMPSANSLELSTNKVKMKEALSRADSPITPEFLAIDNPGEDNIKTIVDEIGFPALVKPASLSQSRLISLCGDEHELKLNLQKTHDYLLTNGLDKNIIVEKFLGGKQFTVDGYVDSFGKVTLCPFVSMTTGYEKGFGDFFSYLTMTPTDLDQTEVEKAEAVISQAVNALGLTNTTVQLDMVLHNEEWFVIEIGARIGSARTTQYQLSYNINHNENDLYIRIPDKKPSVDAVPLGYTAILKLFPKHEGVFKEVVGLSEIQKLPSIKSAVVRPEVGENLLFSRNGGKNVITIILFNQSREELEVDIKKVEEEVKIVTN